MINHPNRKKKTAAASSKSEPHNHQATYTALTGLCQQSFGLMTAGLPTLFRAATSDLFSIFLKNLPKAQRQEHTCSSCRHFIKRYGNLVTIDVTGRTHSVMFSGDAGKQYHAAFEAMRKAVEGGKVMSPFVTKENVWGQPVTGQWQHMAVTPPTRYVHRSGLHTAGQVIARHVHNYKTVSAALKDFTPPLLNEALRILRSEELSRSEKFIAPVQWLSQLHMRTNGVAGSNQLWALVASAPEGFCHPRSSVVGTLLDDIKSGMEFSQIKKRFNKMLGPLAYQRPQAAPSRQNVERAEAVVERLGISQSLERRYARMDDVAGNAVWLPKADKVVAGRGGVFGHLKTKDEGPVPAVDLPATRMTWVKFAANVLPEASDLSLRVPHVGRFIALVTALHEDAPPIVKWDHEEARNPVTWYCYDHGSPATQWRLLANQWCRVNAAVPLPNLWGERPQPEQGNGVVLVLDGAVDTNERSGSGLFPEFLKQALHEVRATVESFSKGAQLAGRDAGSACGYDIRNGNGLADCHLRAKVNGTYSYYQIDRWD